MADSERPSSRPVDREDISIWGIRAIGLRSQAVRDLRALPADEAYMWLEAGPEGLTTNVTLGGHQQGNEPIAGMVMDVAIDGTTLIAATTEGGVWQSLNDGTTWRPLTDTLPALSTGAVATVTLPSGRVIVAGTSDPHRHGIESPRAGLYRSVDGGRTWVIVDGGENATRFADRDVNWIRMLSDQRLLVATNVGLYWSADGGYNFGNDADARNGQPLKDGQVGDLKLDETAAADGSRQAYFAIDGDGLWRISIPATGTPRDPRRIHSARATVATDRVGGIVFDHASPGGHEFWLMSVARDRPRNEEHHSVQIAVGDGTGTWHALTAAEIDAITPTGRDSPQTSYNHTAGIDPLYAGNADDVLGYVGAIELTGARFAESPTRGRSVLGGALAVLGQGQLHDDQHLIAFDRAQRTPHNASTVARTYIGNDGGLYRSNNPFAATPTWTSVSRMRTALFYALAGAARPGGGYYMAGGMQDKGTAFATTTLPAPTSAGDWTWEQIGGGDGGTASVHVLPAGHASGFDVVVFLWENDNLKRCQHTPGQNPAWVKTTTLIPAPADVNFTGVLARARGADHEFSVVYAALGKTGGGGTLHKSVNAFAHAAGARPTFTRLDRQFDARIVAMTAAPRDAAAERGANPPEWRDLWVGLLDGKVFYSEDGGQNWTQRTPSGARERPVTAIAVDPQNSDHLIVTYGGFNGSLPRYRHGHIWLSTDRGVTFRDISGVDDRTTNNLPDAPILSVVFANTTPPAMVVGTSVGVLYSIDLGQSWRRLARTFPNVEVFGLTTFDGVRPAPPSDLATVGLPPIAAGTYGRSAWFLQRAPADFPDVELDGAFGAVPVGTSRERPIRVVNRGRNPVTITGVTSGSGPLRFTGVPTLPATIAPGSSLDWTVRCEPTAPGPVVSELRITTSLPVTPDLPVPLSAEGVSASVPRLSVSPSPYIGFGPLPSSAGPREAVVRLSNSGTGPLIISAIERHLTAFEPDALLSLRPAFTSPIVLAPGDHHDLTLRFDPGVASYPNFEATITIRSNDPTGPRNITVFGGQEVPEWLQIVGVVALVVVVAGAVGGITYLIANETT